MTEPEEQENRANTSHLEKPLSYYIEKFERRVYRRMLEYETLRRHIRSDAENLGPNLVRLLALEPTVIQSTKIKDHLEKNCLVGLKAEFELFFLIYTKQVISRILQLIQEQGGIPETHRGILKALRDHRSYCESFFHSGMRDPSTTFIEHVIPSHGLDRMIDLLSTCGWGAVERLDAIDDDFIPYDMQQHVDGPLLQVRMAFQVRHAIEHSFSKVSLGFKHKTRKLWHRTTWRRPFAQEEGPCLGARILIDEIDIHATAASMTAIVKELAGHWEAFNCDSNTR